MGKKLSFIFMFFILGYLYLGPAFAEMGKDSNTSKNYHYVSPSYYDNNDGVNPGTKTVNGQTYYEIYIPKDNPVNIHTNYANNTDTCASCHATHSATGVSLLQWANPSDTCFACHDGTVTTTYNVREGDFLPTDTWSVSGGVYYYPASGGCFANTPGGDDNISMHNVGENGFSGLNITAAPGGNHNPSESDTTKNGAVISWVGLLTCASCHNPHGAGGNARLLQPNPNGVSQWNELNGIQMYTNGSPSGAKWSVYPDIDNDGNPEKYFHNNYLPSDPNFKTYTDKQVKAYTILNSYPYANQIAIKIFNASNIQVGDTVYPKDTFDNSTGESIFTLPNTVDPSVYTVKIYSAYPAITVGMRIYNTLKTGEYVEYKYGINSFCAACHTDYNSATHQFIANAENKKYFMQFPDQFAYYSGSGGRKEVVDNPGSGSGMSGKYAKAYRHQVGMLWYKKVPGLKFEHDTWNSAHNIQGETGDGKYVVNCLTCHVAHGVSSDYWKRTIGDGDDGMADGRVSLDKQGIIKKYYPNTEAAIDVYPLRIFSNNKLNPYNKTTNPDSGNFRLGGSSLKRMPNMGVCEACHQKNKEASGNSINEIKD